MSAGRRISLFDGPSIDGFFLKHRERVIDKVNSIPEEHLLNSTVENLLDSIVKEFTIKPFELYEEQIEMHAEETKVDVSCDPSFPYMSLVSRPCYVPGMTTKFDIPFSGDIEIFGYRTNPFLSTPPVVELFSEHIRIEITKQNNVSVDKIQAEYKFKFESVKRSMSNANFNIQGYNSNLRNVVEIQLNSRCSRIGDIKNLAKSLNIKLVRNANAPSINPVKINLSPVPKLQKNSADPYPVEYGISPEDYEHILSVIRHQGRAFEKNPSIFSDHCEENLRDFILCQLNGHFEGDATGETFRKSGKTDICIQKDDRAAFVGECKVWSGPNGLSKALNQLLGYLTWRDSKAALIIFNKRNKNISKIIEEITNVLGKHPQFTNNLRCDEKGEWRIEVCGNQDEDRKIIVHVFFFDLHFNGSN